MTHITALHTPLHTQDGLTGIACTQTPVTLVTSELNTDFVISHYQNTTLFFLKKINAFQTLFAVHD